MFCVFLVIKRFQIPLICFQDLVSAVEKFNSFLGSKKETKGSYYFRVDEILSLGLGRFISFLITSATQVSNF